jgi:hypothetical protein
MARRALLEPAGRDTEPLPSQGGSAGSNPVGATHADQAVSGGDGLVSDFWLRFEAKCPSNVSRVLTRPSVCCRTDQQFMPPATDIASALSQTRVRGVPSALDLHLLCDASKPSACSMPTAKPPTTSGTRRTRRPGTSPTRWPPECPSRRYRRLPLRYPSEPSAKRISLPNQTSGQSSNRRRCIC